MANFIEVYDDGGRKQIVDEPIDMTMIAKNIYNPAYDFDEVYSNGSFKRFFYPDTLKSHEALVAMQPSKDPIYADKSILISAAGTAVAGYSNPHVGIYGTIVSGNPPTFYYYSWLPQPISSNQNFGLEVFNEAGEVSWASYNTSMNILDVLKEPDFRYAGGDLENYFTKDYGHQDVAVIVISNPYYQQNNIVYDIGYSFNAAGALRVYRKVRYRLTGDDINQGWNDTIGYRLELLVVDVRNSQYMN